MNELEFSETNAEELKKRGYVLIDDESNTVLGSAETARKAFEACELGDIIGTVGTGMDKNENCAKMNFCSSRYKDAVQLRLRLLRTARQNARAFDEITEDGTIIFGRIKIEAEFLEKLSAFLDENELPEEAYIVDAERNTIETAFGIAEELASIFEEEKPDFGRIQIWIIEQYPFTGGFVVGSERIY